MNVALEVYCCLPEKRRLAVNWRRAELRVERFHAAINDLQRGAVPTARAEAQEGGGILPAAPGEGN